jgi:hypothetical protein
MLPQAEVALSTLILCVLLIRRIVHLQISNYSRSMSVPVTNILGLRRRFMRPGCDWLLVPVVEVWPMDVNVLDL